MTEWGSVQDSYKHVSGGVATESSGFSLGRRIVQSSASVLELEGLVLPCGVGGQAVGT